MNHNRVSDRKMKALADHLRDEELAEFAAHDNDQPVEVSPEFSARMNRLLTKEAVKSQKRTYLLRTAAVLAILLLGISTFFAVNTESRAGFRDWVVEKYRKSFVYRLYGMPLNEPLPVYEPSWIPPAYRKTDGITINQEWDGVFVYQDKDTGDPLVFHYSYYGDSPITISADITDNLFYEKQTVNGFPADFYFERYPKVFGMLLWFDEKQQLVFYLSGALDKETILRVADSVRLTE